MGKDRRGFTGQLVVFRWRRAKMGKAGGRGGKQKEEHEQGELLLVVGWLILEMHLASQILWKLGWMIKEG